MYGGEPFIGYLVGEVLEDRCVPLWLTLASRIRAVEAVEANVYTGTPEEFVVSPVSA